MDHEIINLHAVTKSFGVVRALNGVDLALNAGETVGLVGHNGAGKSTFMNILSGTVAPTSGTLAAKGSVFSDYRIQTAKQLGIRCVFQELSLCPNLTVAENVRVTHPKFRGVGWRKWAAALIESKLDEIFPGHRISPHETVSNLSIGQRQMVEIARAFTVTDTPAQLVILDEPTSSLDQSNSRQLLAFTRRFVKSGGAIVLISHILGEILTYTNRIIVMRNGAVVANGAAHDFDKAKLICLMGGAAKPPVPQARTEVAAVNAPLRVQARAWTQAGRIELRARAGEIIGLAGLAGHGQSQSLVDIFDAAGSRPTHYAVHGAAAFVAGDRQADGVFPIWSIAENITIRSLQTFTKGSLIFWSKSDALAEFWKMKTGIKTPDIHDNILSLSGGNQQKALFARALGSDADIILMDDPMRGVDIGTKLDVYALIRAEAARGRTFIWYTTETEELEHCDRAYIFHNHKIVNELARENLTEERVIQASFEDAI